MIIFDTETTGLVLPSVVGLELQPYIIDFAAVKVDLNKMKIVDQVEFLCKPPIMLPAIITKITGVKDADLADLDPFSNHYEEVANLFVGEFEVVAHNVAFDTKLLEFELTRMGKQFQFPWPMRRCCTVEATYHLKNRRLKMTELYEIATGKPLGQKHRAMSDVMDLWEIVKWMHKERMPL